jgi:hypothetical protein
VKTNLGACDFGYFVDFVAKTSPNHQSKITFPQKIFAPKKTRNALGCFKAQNLPTGKLAGIRWMKVGLYFESDCKVALCKKLGGEQQRQTSY